MKYDDGKSCMSGGEPCLGERAPGRRFCGSCCVILDRAGREMSYRYVPRFTNGDAEAAWVAARKAEPKPVSKPVTEIKPRPITGTVCRVDLCGRSPREASDLCYRHRGQPLGANVVEDGCQYPACERKATSLSGRCKRHPVKLDGAAQAA